MAIKYDVLVTASKGESAEGLSRLLGWSSGQQCCDATDTKGCTAVSTAASVDRQNSSNTISCDISYVHRILCSAKFRWLHQNGLQRSRMHPSHHWYYCGSIIAHFQKTVTKKTFVFLFCSLLTHCTFESPRRKVQSDAQQLHFCRAACTLL